MTNGTSQGLFVVVAIIIFGIFVLINYLLFKDNLKPTLANIFTDGLEHAEENLTEIEKENPSINSEISTNISDLNFDFNKLDYDSPTFPRLSEPIQVTIKNLTDEELSYKVKFIVTGKGLFIGDIENSDINSIYTTELIKFVNLKPNEVVQFDIMSILNAQEYESTKPDTYTISSSATHL